MTSAQRKLARGIEHADLLCDEARAFEESQAYVLRTEQEPRPPEHIHYTCFAVKQREMPDHWPLLAGDALQNFRSALEHAVWEASAPRFRRRAQFPIFRDRCEFQVIGRPMIAGLKAPIRALVEQAQPCNIQPDTPEFDPLWILSSLSNLDKHRSLATVVASTTMSYVGWDGEKTDLFEFTYFGLGETLHEDAKVLSFLATKGVKVDPKMFYQVMIERHPLATTIFNIKRRVIDVVAMIETGEPRPIGPAFVIS